MSTQERLLPAGTNLITTGLALFSMFFGAGNLIFPLLIGKSAGQNVWFAISGLGLTAVVVPFLGLAAMILFQADCKRFFGRIGKFPGLILLLLLQSILGPFGVIPRLITLMHATIEPYLFGIPLLPFSLLSAAVIFVCSFQRKRLISFLGAYLTPILLLSLAALVFFGITQGSSPQPVSASPTESFAQGLLEGYNTMDLIAAFFFATVILPHFQSKGVTQRRSLLKQITLSSLIAASLLFLTYVGLSLVAARHGALTAACPPEQMLGVIATQLLGKIGGAIAATAVITACLTTAMTLTAIFADYLRKDLCQEKIGPTTALILTLVITTFFANLGFQGIAAFLGPLLQFVYPGLILLTFFNLYQGVKGINQCPVATLPKG